MTKQLENLEKILQVRDLIIEFGSGKKKVKAVKGATFDVYKGETLGLVGESGSGKTTIGRAIMGIQPVTDGAIYFNQRLIYGKAPDLYAINLKLLRNLQMMQENQKATSLSLNNYLEEFKRLFYKYTQSKYYDFNTRALTNYPDGRSRIIPEGTNLKETKLVKAKKDVNLAVVQEAVQDNLKRLLKIIRLEAEALQFSIGISEFSEVPLILEKTLNEAQEKVSNLVVEVKNRENQITLDLGTMSKIRQTVLAGKFTSISQYFEEMGFFLQEIIRLQKEITPLLKLAMELQRVVLYLAAPRDKKKKYRQFLKARINAGQENPGLIAQDLLNYYQTILEQNDHDRFNYDELIRKSPIFKKPTKHEQHELKKKMQMIFQDPSSSLNDRMAVEEIIGEGLDNFPELYKNPQTYELYLQWYNQCHDSEHQITLAEVTDKAVKHFLVLQLLTTVGMLPEHLSRYPHEFSGGQRQRIGIARALVMRPSFIIADEPISALDVSIRAQVMNLLAKFQKEFDLTYIFIAHDLSIVKFMATRIAVIYRGDIVELAEATELFENPLHPYTKSLLSAIPLPDPELERAKIPFKYYPQREHPDYLIDFPQWTEVADNHFVYANQREIKQYRAQLAPKIT